MIAANAALIAILQVTRLRWLQLNSGFKSISTTSSTLCPQPLHLAQLEPELFLQSDRRLFIGKVETNDTGDVWKHFRDSQLHQRVVWTNEAGLPRWDGGEGAHNLTF